MKFSLEWLKDFLDTEAYLDCGGAATRAGHPPLSEYLARFDDRLDAMTAAVRVDGHMIGAGARGPVTERRPGTYIYYDRMQVRDKVASFDDCALTVLATVVSMPTST